LHRGRNKNEIILFRIIESFFKEEVRSEL